MGFLGGLGAGLATGLGQAAAGYAGGELQARHYGLQLAQLQAMMGYRGATLADRQQRTGIAAQHAANGPIDQYGASLEAMLKNPEDLSILSENGQIQNARADLADIIAIHQGRMRAEDFHPRVWADFGGPPHPTDDRTHAPGQPDVPMPRPGSEMFVPGLSGPDAAPAPPAPPPVDGGPSLPPAVRLTGPQDYTSTAQQVAALPPELWSRVAGAAPGSVEVDLRGPAGRAQPQGVPQNGAAPAVNTPILSPRMRSTIEMQGKRGRAYDASAGRSAVETEKLELGLPYVPNQAEANVRATNSRTQYNNAMAGLAGGRAADIGNNAVDRRTRTNAMVFNANNTADYHDELLRIQNAQLHLRELAAPAQRALLKAQAAHLQQMVNAVANSLTPDEKLLLPRLLQNGWGLRRGVVGDVPRTDPASMQARAAALQMLGRHDPSVAAALRGVTPGGIQEPGPGTEDAGVLPAGGPSAGAAGWQPDPGDEQTADQQIQQFWGRSDFTAHLNALPAPIRAFYLQRAKRLGKR